MCIVYCFDDLMVVWEYQFGVEDVMEVVMDIDDYEVFEVDDEFYFVQFYYCYFLNEVVLFVFDLWYGCFFVVIFEIFFVFEQGCICVQYYFVFGIIEGVVVIGVEVVFMIMFIGCCVEWVYSEEYVYEYVYFFLCWYLWQCLVGLECGFVDIDENSVWEVCFGIYIFVWCEKVILCVLVMIVDYCDVNVICFYGVLFGLDESGEVLMYFMFGVYGCLLLIIYYILLFEFVIFGDV